MLALTNPDLCSHQWRYLPGGRSRTCGAPKILERIWRQSKIVNPSGYPQDDPRHPQAINHPLRPLSSALTRLSTNPGAWNPDAPNRPRECSRTRAWTNPFKRPPPQIRRQGGENNPWDTHPGWRGDWSSSYWPRTGHNVFTSHPGWIDGHSLEGHNTWRLRSIKASCVLPTYLPPSHIYKH